MRRFGRAIAESTTTISRPPCSSSPGCAFALASPVPLATTPSSETSNTRAKSAAPVTHPARTTFWAESALRQGRGGCERVQLGVAVHSSGELGIQLATMLHLGAVVPNLSFAADAHYHHVADDIIEGGKLQYEQGAIRVPDGPGLGVRLDRRKLALYAERYREQGNYAYDQDPARPGWAPLVPNDRWADPSDDREPFVRG